MMLPESPRAAIGDREGLARELTDPAPASCLPETEDSATFAELLKQIDKGAGK